MLNLTRQVVIAISTRDRPRDYPYADHHRYVESLQASPGLSSHQLGTCRCDVVRATLRRTGGIAGWLGKGITHVVLLLIESPPPLGVLEKSSELF